MTFLPIPGTAGADIDDYCGYPTGAYAVKKCCRQICLHNGDFTITNIEFIDGSCDPFYLEFEATGLYWNCDCCQAGGEEDDNNVTMTVTIT